MLDALSVHGENELGRAKSATRAIPPPRRSLQGKRGVGGKGGARRLTAPTPKSVLELGDVQADYDRAGEVLSCLADAAYAGGSRDAIRTVEMLLDQRLATELAIVGTFVAAGRE